MRKPHIFRLFLISILALSVLAACSQEATPVPTTVTTAESPTSESPSEAQPDPTAETPTDDVPVPSPSATPADLAPVPPSDINWPPQALYTVPDTAQELPVDGSITVRFDQPMDAESVEAAWTLAPALEGEFEWPDDDTLVFTPRDPFERQASYRVQVGDSAESRNGYSLSPPLDLTFQTTGNLTVMEQIPAPDSRDIDTDASITVVFNRPVVPLTSSGQQDDLPQPLTLAPAVEGQGEWVTTAVYRFTPTEPLAGATTYIATVEAGLEDLTGSTLAEDVVWRFTTFAPDVVSVYPPNGSSLILPSSPITVTFNMPMDRASTEGALSLQADAPAVDFDFEWQDDDRVMVAQPQDLLALNTSYEIVMAQSARSAEGSASLTNEVSPSFRTVPLPAIIETWPEANQETDPWSRGVTLTFASPMDPDTLEGRIQIDPPPDEEPRYTYNEWIDTENPSFSSFSLFLDFEYERETDYTITVPADVADPYGNTLGEPFVLRFTTPSLSSVASFNLPSMVSQLSTSFPTNVDVIHRNVDEFSVSLTNLGLPTSLLYQPYNVQDYTPSAEAATETFDFDVSTPDDEVEVTSVELADGEMLPTGVYYLQVQAPGLREDARYWQNQRNLLVVAGTNLIIKEMPNEVRVWVTDLETGQPAAGVPVTFYNDRGAEVGSAVTDQSGFAGIDYESPDGYQAGVVAVASEPGQPDFGAASTSWTGELNIWELGLPMGYDTVLPEMTYIYTDRPIYRPGDTVHIKGIVRDNDFARYGLPQERTVDLRITTDFYSEDGVGYQTSVPVTIGADGTFTLDFDVPDGAPLGTYRLALDVGDISGAGFFTVAEYRRPEYQVTMTPASTEALRGEATTKDLDVTYYFGANAGELPVNYSYYEQEYWPQFDGPPYAFGDSAGFDYDGQPYFMPPAGVYGNWVANAEGRTDANGHLTIDVPADLLEDVDPGSRRVTIEATVMDLSNFPVTTTAEVIYHAADGYVGVRPTEYVSAEGTDVFVDLQTIDWEGDPLADQSVDVVFYLREWESSREATFTTYDTVWTPVDTEVASVSVVTDADGQATASFVPEEPGSYIAVATLTDDAGRTQFSSTHLWVINENFAGWRSESHDKTMALVLDKDQYSVGETAQILVQSPFTEPTQAWLFIERGNMVEERVITLSGGTEVVDLPISAEYAPNVFVTIAAVKPVNRDDTNYPYADIRVGIVELLVEPDEFELDIQITPQGDLFGPGETAVFEILTTNQGSPISADVSVALVDLAILSLIDDNATPIMEAFYSPVPLRSNMGSGLFVSGEGREVEVPIEGLGGGGGGGGDLAESAVGVLEEEDDTRRNFPDTAYWNPSVVTDANGTAEIEIELPDTLTTWRLHAKGVTDDTKVGQNSAEIVTSLPLLVRPVTPRFFTVEDQVEIGTIVNNTTDEDIEATVSLEAGGFTSGEFEDQVVTVPANGQTLVRWSVTVADVAFVDMTFRAEGGGYSDASKPPLGVGPNNQIPVYRYDAPDITGTANEMLVAGQSVEAILLPPAINPDRGSVDVVLSPSLAASLVDALTVVEEQEVDINCAHAVVDRLLPNLATELMIDELDLAMAELDSAVASQNSSDVPLLEGLQRRDGGWGFCSALDSNDWLTAYALLALAKAQEAGYSVDSFVYDRALDYVERRIAPIASITDSEDANRQAFYLYVLAEAGTFVDVDADELVEAHRGLLDSYAKGLLVSAYAINDATGDNYDALLSDLSNEAILSATSVHWEDMEPDYFNLSSDVRGTAMVIDALSRSDPESSLLDGAVRWLMVARTAEVWRTSHETAWAIFALSHYLQSTGELQAAYEYQLNVNATPLVEGNFSAETITNSEEVRVPIRTLSPDETNYFDFRRGEGSGKLYYTMHLNSYISAEAVSATSQPITVTRTYFDAACDPETEPCEPIDTIEAGQQVRVVLTLTTPNDLVYAVVEDPYPAGAEGIDPQLNTTQATRGGSISPDDQPTPYGYWGWWYFEDIQFRDEKVVFTSQFLPAGTYQYTYYLQTSLPGEFQVMPTLAYQAFFPETFGRSDGMLFTISAESEE